MRALTRKSPDRRNHAILAYSPEHTTWVMTDEYFNEDTGCHKKHYKCVASSEHVTDACDLGDLNSWQNDHC